MTRLFTQRSFGQILYFVFTRASLENFSSMISGRQVRSLGKWFGIFSRPIWGNRNNPDAECKVGIRLNAFRNRGGTIVHIQHLSTDSKSLLYPGQDGCGIKSVAARLPGERIFQKQVNSAFIGTGLETHLREHPSFGGARPSRRAR